jgi:hypothetical protein
VHIIVGSFFCRDPPFLLNSIVCPTNVDAFEIKNCDSFRIVVLIELVVLAIDCCKRTKITVLPAVTKRRKFQCFFCLVYVAGCVPGLQFLFIVGVQCVVLSLEQNHPSIPN